MGKGWRRFFSRSADKDEDVPAIEGNPGEATGAPPALLGEPEPEPAEGQAPAQIEQGLRYIGHVIDHLDRHLEESNRLLANVAREQEAMPELVREMTQSLAAQREVQQALANQAREHDRTANAIVDRLEKLGNAFEQQRTQHRDDLALVTRAQRSGRRLLVFLLLLTTTAALVLLALVLALAVRPDLVSTPVPWLVGQPRAEPAATPSPKPGPASTPDPAEDRRQDLLWQAATSADPAIRAAALHLLRQEARAERAAVSP